MHVKSLCENHPTLLLMQCQAPYLRICGLTKRNKVFLPLTLVNVDRQKAKPWDFVYCGSHGCFWDLCDSDPTKADDGEMKYRHH